MAKGNRGAGEKARALREAQRLAEVQRLAEARRKAMIKTVSIVGGVLLLVVVLVVVKLVAGPAKAATATSPAPAALVASVTGVPAATLDAIGVGEVDTLPKATSGSPAVLKVDGKPLVFYMGAEYCPFCAAERWPMIVAMSRFGTFGNLSQTFSSSTDSYPNTPTFSFHGATYTSDYLTFQAAEVLTNQPASGGGYTALDKLTTAQQQVLDQYDPAPAGQQGNPYPFVDLANQAVVAGASYDPALLAGKTQEQVAAALTDTSSPIAKAIIGSANALTIKLCTLTGGLPATVCTSAAVGAYAAAA